jgi:transcriptional regulator with XRE-family HTH domain
MLEINKKIGNKIKHKRKELGVTQYELGRILGCSQQSIQNNEVGYCSIPIDTLNDFAKLCMLPIDWFFAES